MGQIIGGAAKPKRCNLNQLSQLGTPAAGEYILVSSDNSMNAAGQGNFDCYIVGDGTTAATALTLNSLADSEPTKNSKNSVTSGSVYNAIYGKIYYGGESSRLPSGYKELSWIESSGEQYIDTGITGHGVWKFSAQVVSTIGSSQILVGKSSGAAQWFGATNGHKWGFGNGAGAYTSVDSMTKVECEITFGDSMASGVVNGENCARSGLSVAGNYLLFASPSCMYPIKARLWEITFEISNEVVFQGIPCRNPNNEVGLYDLINSQFIGNIGTGAFIGSDE